MTTAVTEAQGRRAGQADTSPAETQQHRVEDHADNDPLTSRIIGAAIEVHRHWGPGLLESVYEDCLCHELSLRDIRFCRQIPIPLTYKGLNLDSTYRLDIVVENTVIVELKATETVLPVHRAQLLSYLRLTGKRVGLLINFHVPYLSKGVERFVL
jgi:GxxExxY protein